MAIATTLETPLEFLPDAPELRARRFSVDEYLRLIELGMFADHERLELLEGLIVPMMTRLPPHEVALRLVAKALDRVIPSGYDLRSQSAVQLKSSVPEPDCAVVIGDTRRYSDHHPGPGEIELVVEVADSSLRIDRTTKAGIYASDRIAAYWIVNLPDRQVEVLTDPAGDVETPCYRNTAVFKPGDKIALVLGDKVVGEISVADLLP